MTLEAAWPVDPSTEWLRFDHVRADINGPAPLTRELTGTPPSAGLFDVGFVSSDGRDGFAEVLVTITVE